MIAAQPLHHDDAPPAEFHVCEARIWAVCAACNRTVTFCWASRRTVHRIMARLWTCGACQP